MSPGSKRSEEGEALRNENGFSTAGFEDEEATWQGIGVALESRERPLDNGPQKGQRPLSYNHRT